MTAADVDPEVLGRFALATALAREAGALAQGYFHRRAELVVEHKGVQDLVTLADREVEALIRRRIAERFPRDGILGEEQGGERAEALWIVDPIDGTTNFVRGLLHWCVSLTWARAGVTEFGVVYAPMLDELFTARRGAGATLNGVPMRVSDTRALQGALVGLGYTPHTQSAPYVRTVEALLKENALYRFLGSGTLMLCQVAAGRLDAGYEAFMYPWDALPALLMVREAGGRTWPDESVREWPGGLTLAANPHLFEPMRQVARIP